MSLIDKEVLLDQAKRCHFTKAVIECIERQDEVMCECEIAGNAALICAILDADAEGRVWTGDVS